MRPREIHRRSGESGRFGEFFVALGVFVGLLGIAHIVIGATDLLPHFEGFPSVTVDNIQSGVMFLLLGTGIVIFGIMAIRAGWGRQHPDSDW